MPYYIETYILVKNFLKKTTTYIPRVESLGKKTNYSIFFACRWCHYEHFAHTIHIFRTTGLKVV